YTTLFRSLTAVISVQTLNDKRKCVDQVFQQGQQKGFADLRHGADELILCLRIDDVDVISALDAVEIALVNRVHAQIARLTIGFGTAALGDGDACGPGLVDPAPPTLIARAVTQVVELAIGDPGQTLVTPIRKDIDRK